MHMMECLNHLTFESLQISLLDIALKFLMGSFYWDAYIPYLVVLWAVSSMTNTCAAKDFPCFRLQTIKFPTIPKLF